MKIKFKRIKSIVVFLLLALTSYAQQTAQISISFEVYDDAGGYKNLNFGLDQSATDGIDYQLGESDLPPYPPSGAFDVRWLLPENNFSGSLSSWKDYRYVQGFPYSGTYEHRLRYQSTESATKIFFSWNLPQEVTGLLQDLINGSYVNISVSGNGTYELTNFTVINKLKLMVYYNNIVTLIADENDYPLSYKLEQNYPNPFNPNTTIKWQSPVDGWHSLRVFDVLGNEVARLVDEYKSAGSYKIEWNTAGLDRYTSGIYFYQLTIGDYVQTRKMLLLK